MKAFKKDGLYFWSGVGHFGWHDPIGQIVSNLPSEGRSLLVSWNYICVRDEYFLRPWLEERKHR